LYWWEITKHNLSLECIWVCPEHGEVIICRVTLEAEKRGAYLWRKSSTYKVASRDTRRFLLVLDGF
jgi:hypothetical protein